MRPLAFDLEPARSIVAALVLVLAMSAPGCEPAASSGPTQAADRNAKDAEPTAPPRPSPTSPSTASISPSLASLTRTDSRSPRSETLSAPASPRSSSSSRRCATTCPILAGQFEGVRARLGDAMGRDFLLISVTVDPEYDRPETLKDWGRRHGARPGWSLLTGSQAEVDRLLAGLGVAAADPKNHQSRVLVVDGVTSRGLWTSGRPPPTNWSRSSARSDLRRRLCPLETRSGNRHGPGFVDRPGRVRGARTSLTRLSSITRAVRAGSTATCFAERWW